MADGAPSGAVLKQILSDIKPAQRAGATALGLALNPVGGPQASQFPGTKIGPDGLLYVPIFDEATQTYGYQLAPQWLQEAAGVIATDGGAAGGGVTQAELMDPALVRLQQQATLQATLGEEQRAAEMQPVDLAYKQSVMETGEADLQRGILSDKFTMAQNMWDAAQLADQLATAKRRDAANTLTDLINNIVPAGMTSLPGLPGSTMPTVASIDFGQFTQGLSPETDAALKYLMQTGQQTTAGLQGLQSQQTGLLGM